jgi:hypothetical protein
MQQIVARHFFMSVPITYYLDGFFFAVSSIADCCTTLNISLRFWVHGSCHCVCSTELFRDLRDVMALERCHFCIFLHAAFTRPACSFLRWGLNYPLWRLCAQSMLCPVSYISGSEVSTLFVPAIASLCPASEWSFHHSARGTASPRPFIHSLLCWVHGSACRTRRLANPLLLLYVLLDKRTTRPGEPYTETLKSLDTDT